MDPVLGAYGIGAGMDLLGSLFGYGAKKKAQNNFDMSLEDLRGMQGKPVLDVGGIQTANRAAMFPRIRDLTRDVSQQHNLDQPKVKQYLMDKLFDQEAEQLPGLMERNQGMTADRDLMIKRAIAAFRAAQLG